MIQLTGTIFDIKRCAFEDGPGIRTTVFFKGCNMRCHWCHNPESWEKKPQILFYKNKCTGCKSCEAALATCVGRECIACGKCAAACPNGTRIKVGVTSTVDEVMCVILSDREYYGKDGGATFSGGECMLQIDFLYELLKRCHENSINTAVDTSGNVPFEYFNKIDGYTDIYLYDVKCVTPELHKLHTGVSNELILSNLNRLDPGKIIVRIPIIEDFNKNQAEKDKIYNLIAHLKITAIEELPYHKLGESKRAAIDHHIHSRIEK